MPSLTTGQVIAGFRVERCAEIPMMNAHYWKLVHEKTGATLYYSDRDDGQMMFTVGFRTLPENDTGVFHILEHSSLDGSEHFPLKEPFVNLIKTSLSVDLNAVTYEDKTLYYFISTNEKDFMNMMSVYLDAVFHPLLLSDRRIFEKEAWHLEPTEDGGVNVSGVVFNEMQGTENQPGNAMWFQMEKQIFPDLFYRFSSGGDPTYIHDLTYEQFKETYHRFYGTDNAILYLSGNMGLVEELTYIDGVLCSREAPAAPRPDPAPLQTPVVSPDGSVCYQLAENEPIEGNTRLLLTFVLNDGEGNKVPGASGDALALGLLCRYLAETTESPLEKAVLDANVGQDFSMEVDGDNRQPLVLFSLGKSDPENAESFRRVLLDTLKELVSKGFDAQKLRDLIANHETDCRRASLSVRSGYRIMESLLRTHVQYGDACLPDDLAAVIAKFDADPRYFEHLIERYVLESDHWALTKCIPSRTVTSDRKAKMDVWLKSEADKLHAEPGAYEALTEHFAAFNRYLTAPDSPEAEASIPHLTPADIHPAARSNDAEVLETPIGGSKGTSLRFITDTNGMVTANLLFDMRGVAPDDLYYAARLCDALFSLPTADHTVPELTDRRVALRTNMGVYSAVYNRVGSDGKTVPYLRITLDTPEENLKDVTAMIGEYLSEPQFDRTILRRLFSNASDLRSRMVRRGNSTAIRMAESRLHVNGVYGDRLNGISAFRRQCRLADHFDEEADAFVEGLTRVSRHLFTEAQPLAAFTGSEKAYADWCEALAALPVASALPAEPAVYTLTPYDRSNPALTIPGEVNYCVTAYDLSAVGASYSPTMNVVAGYLHSKYFWDEIRAKGGAYGANASVFNYGMLALSSYRDPRVSDTYAVYDRLPDWLEANLPGEDELGSLIVSSLSPFFAPQSPIDKGNEAIDLYLTGRTSKNILNSLTTILGTTVDDFKSFADTVRRLNASGTAVRAVLGGKKSVEGSGLFDEIAEL